MKPSSQDRRSEYITGLRELADWLEQHPDVAVPSDERMLLPLLTNTAVEEFAATHGLTIETDSDGNMAVDLRFGCITYHVYGYVDFAEHRKKGEEKQARAWADSNDMVIQPREVASTPSHADRVVAYRNPWRPGVLLCREHGEGWAGMEPLTSDDLPDGGTCTHGDPADPSDVCGRDVLIDAPQTGGAR
ncbi:hypothetical protein [Streptomyces sp. NPDC050416]|uniref:hypothetical protein n=1 Tax=Streptomyces sp. NPDC050416 TaxID=3365611 RepID=UPI0037A570E7